MFIFSICLLLLVDTIQSSGRPYTRCVVSRLSSLHATKCDRRAGIFHHCSTEHWNPREKRKVE